MQLPTPEQIRLAVDLYLRRAYEGEPPESVRAFLPAPDMTPEDWLLGLSAECDPRNATLKTLRSSAFRLGNSVYPHMKLRISRPPNRPVFLFSVDAHDAMLQAKPGTPDHAMLQELKAHNARLVEAIHADWDAAGLPTERTYLRQIVEQTRARQNLPTEPSSGQPGETP